MNFSAFDHQCMTTALRLAQRGLNTTHPNPRVGCVIALDEAVIGSGWHEKTGEAHAEINALRSAGSRAAGATAYVTLEPCNHSGRTPPCVDALIKAKVSRVVFALKDPNPDVSGSGSERLLKAGREVQSGLMAEQAESLNAGFLKRMRQGLPWVRVKLAICRARCCCSFARSDSRSLLCDCRARACRARRSLICLSRWLAGLGARLLVRASKAFRSWSSWSCFRR